MRFKLIVVFAEDSTTEAVIDAARDAGATGSRQQHPLILPRSELGRR